ncbi:Pkg21D [Symbiodinium pilosum]|uniref:cGMP-dependent protein kinase n=1 Tax=Symbiodinium pilosum TaxID=2952 RepID=A0A812IRW8_SYMPI|nr:Pkg21D [Symbiodinium pilosum]
MSSLAMPQEKKREYARKATQKRVGSTSRKPPPVEEHLDQFEVKKEIEKDTRVFLKNAMKQDRLCATLDDAEIESILNTVKFYKFDKGTPIIQEGRLGTTFFVTQTGSMEVSVKGITCNTIGAGCAFGGLALLYNCPRTATVKATANSEVWGASGVAFKQSLQQNATKHQAETLKFLDAMSIFEGLTKKQKNCVAEATFSEVFEDKARVVTAGDMQTAIYFVKKGELAVYSGGHVKSTGEFVDGSEIGRLGQNDCFGESQVVSKEPFNITILSSGRSELLCVSVAELKVILGDDLGAVLERNAISQGLKKCPVISQFTASQRSELMKWVVVKDYAASAEADAGARIIIVLEGSVSGLEKEKEVKLQRGDWIEDEALLNSSSAASSIKNMKAGSGGARVAMLTRDGMASALKALGVSIANSAEDASDFTRKMVLAKKVHIFRHLSEEQTKKVVESFVTMKFAQGETVIEQGTPGTSFFVIANGELEVFINDKSVRRMTRNSYIGERALLFHEPRTATVKVVSDNAELWAIEKATFEKIIAGNMQQQLMNRIRLQDTNFGLKDLIQVKVIGAGAAGVVRLVEHKSTGMRYALKRVKKVDGEVPEEVQRECSLLKDIDHPFIMTQVNTFETKKSVYILTELITGGELHGAIREIPTVLSRAQAQFYTGSLVIVLEELSERNILYRDLKPENVMLDAQGYLKLIDFGIAKKLPEGESKTFTMIGTPHYMAPEVMRGHGYGTEVDLWSMGVMLYEFVCGYLPFADDLDDPTEVCTAVLKDPLQFASSYKDAHGKTLMKGLLTRQPRIWATDSYYEYCVSQQEYSNTGKC